MRLRRLSAKSTLFKTKRKTATGLVLSDRAPSAEGKKGGGFWRQ